METIKKNSIIIQINKLGKMYEIKKITTTKTTTTYSKQKEIDKKINLLITPLKEIENIIDIKEI